MRFKWKSQFPKNSNKESFKAFNDKEYAKFEGVMTGAYDAYVTTLEEKVGTTFKGAKAQAFLSRVQRTQKAFKTKMEERAKRIEAARLVEAAKIEAKEAKLKAIEAKKKKNTLKITLDETKPFLDKYTEFVNTLKAENELTQNEIYDRADAKLKIWISEAKAEAKMNVE